MIRKAHFLKTDYFVDIVKILEANDKDAQELAKNIKSVL